MRARRCRIRHLLCWGVGALSPPPVSGHHTSCRLSHARDRAPLRLNLATSISARRPVLQRHPLAAAIEVGRGGRRGLGFRPWAAHAWAIREPDSFLFYLVYTLYEYSIVKFWRIDVCWFIVWGARWIFIVAKFLFFFANFRVYIDFFHVLATVAEWKLFCLNRTM